ncbi:Root phototropism protein [Hibiscus syriacus]|uniref:Root phototropism protein n=1 Tax=Hibiscus syriacus TaxID=106335 RepID=A0A6A3BU42_HIBSY|nr:stemmadenine O-acetyltransferase-like [Hibiscus syriacus]KAE8720223.1 Root phototropism protein [Hibiscus syriacus]
MVEIKSEIVSRQSIRPSHPTPSHLKTFKLPLLDQISPNIHGNMTFFYPSDNTSHSTSDHDFFDKSKLLQGSISKTLSLFYPLAGRLHDAATVDCNDEGAFFVEAKVNIQLSHFLNQPDLNLMDHFLPATDATTMELSNGAMFLVRFTSFGCGVVAISLSLTHKLFDVSSLLTLLQTWSSVCRGSSDPITPVLIGEKFLAPRDELSAISATIKIDAEKFVQRRFVFSASKIAELKAEVNKEFHDMLQSHPSRVEVVLALLWKCAVATKKQKTGTFGPTVMFQAVNLRKRLSPTLPETAVGNFIWTFMVSAYEERDLELHEAVIQMRKCLNEFNDTKANVLRGEGAAQAIMEAIKERGEFFRNNKEMTVYKCSSWCKFPLYDPDFGWGKPLWLVSVNKLVSNTIALADTRSGDGIEVIMTLDEEEMTLFQQNEQLLKYATPNPSSYA